MGIPAGEIVVFVGPSGCGKTTTMRMINRLIEPTSGKITIGGKDALSIDAGRAAARHRLRRSSRPDCSRTSRSRKNVGMVPGLLGWDKKKIADRVDEMLDLVGLEPATTTATATPGSSPAASSSASGWPGRWPPTRRCC